MFRGKKVCLKTQIVIVVAVFYFGQLKTANISNTFAFLSQKDLEVGCNTYFM